MCDSAHLCQRGGGVGFVEPAGDEGADGDDGPAAERAVPFALIAQHGFVVDVAGIDGEACVPEAGGSACERFVERSGPAVGRAFGGDVEVELDDHHLVGGLERGDVEARVGEDVALMLGVGRECAVGEPSAAADAEAVEGHEQLRQLIGGAQEHGEVGARLGLEMLGQSGDGQDPSPAASGRSSTMRLPRPGALSTIRAPPAARARSPIRSRPKCPSAAESATKPGPSSAITRLRRPPAAYASIETVAPRRVVLDVGECLGQHPQRDGRDLWRDLGQSLVAAERHPQPALGEPGLQLLECWLQPREGRRGDDVGKARPDRLVRGGHGGAQSRLACFGDRFAGLGVEQGQLADGEREILRETVVDVGGEAHAFSLERRALEIAPQPRGLDAGTQEIAEHAQHRGGARVDRGQGLRAADHDPQPSCSGAERQQEPRIRPAA